jgi:hypothetical protein
MIVFGIDNGVTGSIGIYKENYVNLFNTPVINRIDYQKTKIKKITRIDTCKLEKLLLHEMTPREVAKAYIERPMVNPGRFSSTMSAIRSLEATLIVLERLGIEYEFVDSKQWQKKYLGLITREQYEANKKILKHLSLSLAQEKFNLNFSSFVDADGLWIAKYGYENENK